MDEPWTKTMHSLTSHRRPELGSSAVPVGCLHNPLGLLAGREQQPERMEPFVFGQSATPGASSGGGVFFVCFRPFY